MPQTSVGSSILQSKKQRVGVYVRVGNSGGYDICTAQTEYYMGYIQKRKNWEFAGVYVDAGIPGTGMKDRHAWKKLLQDCQDGKIDRILVKSISQFSRNTIDFIQTIQELNHLGVVVEFEKEHLSSIQDEIFLTLLE